MSEAWKDILPIVKEYYKENGDFILSGLNFSEARPVIGEYCRTIEDSARRIQNIVCDLMAYSTNGKDGENRPVNLNHLVHSSLTLLKNKIAKSTRHFRVEQEEGIPAFQGNFQCLEQVVVNLLQNACQAISSPEEEIRIKTSYDRDTEELVLEIIDQGVGGSEEVISRLSEPFYTTKRDSGGTGLGLSVSSAIIEKHGGDMRFRSSLGEGTSVTVKFPLQARGL